MPYEATVYGNIGKFQDMVVGWFPLTVFEFSLMKNQIILVLAILCLQST